MSPLPNESYFILIQFQCINFTKKNSRSIFYLLYYIMPKSGFSLYQISLVIATSLYNVANFQDLCWLDQYSWLVAIMLNLSCCITNVVGGMMDALIDLVRHYQTQKYITQVYFILVLFIFPQHCLMRLFWQELVYSSAFCYYYQMLYVWLLEY